VFTFIKPRVREPGAPGLCTVEGLWTQAQILLVRVQSVSGNEVF
jgi:hypothetical protein